VTSSNTTPNTTPAAARPSLTSGASATDGGGLRILASLNDGGRTAFDVQRARNPWPWPWVVGGASLVVALAIYAWPPQTVVTASPMAAVPIVEVPPPGAVAAPVSVAATSVLADAPMTARIEDLGAAQDGDVNTQRDDPFAGLEAAAPASGQPAAKPADRAANKPATPVKRPRAESSKGTRVAAAPAAGNTTRTPSKRKPADARGDPDVDLLAALMVHVSGNGGVAAGAPSTRKQAAPMDAPTIAKLVGRCEALSGKDAINCRRRICDGYWGKAQACPSKLDAREP